MTPNPAPPSSSHPGQNLHADPDPTSEILHALANPTPPPNLEQRILQSLNQHLTARHALTTARPQTVRQRLHAARHILFPTGAIAVATLLATLSWTISQPHPNTTATHLPTHATAPTPTQLPTSTPTDVAPIPLTPSLPATHTPSPVTSLHPPLTAINRPPPPLPLTEQEKLLRRIALTRDPDQLALLNPEIRARNQAADEAEFQTFFKPPPPLPDLDQTQPTTPTHPTAQTGDTL